MTDSYSSPPDASAAGATAPDPTLPSGAPDPIASKIDDATMGAHLDQTFANRFQVNKGQTPREQAEIAAAQDYSMITGDAAPASVAQARYQQRVANETAAKQKAAQLEFDKSYSLATAPADMAFVAYKGMHPDAAAAVARAHGLDPTKYDKWTQDQKDDMNATVQKYTAMANTRLMKFTGDEVVDKAG